MSLAFTLIDQTDDYLINQMISTEIGKKAEIEVGQLIISHKNSEIYTYFNHNLDNTCHMLYHTIGKYEKVKPMTKPKNIDNPELAWLERNFDELNSKYLNQWVAISGEKGVIASGKVLGDVVSLARKKGFKSPFITRIDPDRWERL